MRSKLRIAVFCGLAFLLATGAARGVETPLPIWSPLTPFETRTLHHIERARAGDADTLLALALIASGDIRDQKAYDRIRNRVQRFIQTHRAEILSQKSIYARGEKLLHAMHADFFAGDGKGQHSGLIGGYDAEQSKVSVIFRDGRFNCISSAILYIVLARYFNLNVEGVVTSQHAFVQIRDEDGRPIEVETTAYDGYGLTHDAKFYRTRFTRFSLSRNLSVPTYADYLKRRVLPPYRFIAENMNHQHTSRERMKTADRQRLSEMLGYIDAETPASQLIRLNALNNACIRWIAKNADADRISTVLQRVLRHVQSRAWIGHTEQSKVAEIWDRIGALHLMLGHLQLNADRFTAARDQYTLALKWSREKNLKKQAKIGLLNAQVHEAFDDHRWESAIEIYSKLLSLLDKNDNQRVNTTHENIATAYWNWANTAANKGHWSQAAERYASAASWTRNRDTKKHALSARANAEAMHHLQNGEWDLAIKTFKTILSGQDAAGRKVVRANIGSAYVRWGNALFHQQAFRAALDKFEAALDVLQGENRNLVIRNIAAAYHNMMIPHLNAHQPQKAVALLKSATKRFPTCAPCRQELRDLQQRLKAASHRE
jgi:tetratricopeptide (TPR) repeat protein